MNTGFDKLRQAFLENYQTYDDCFPSAGPCGAVATALARLGFGVVARIYAITEKERPDCVPVMHGTSWCLPHYVVKGNYGVLDVALPPDFKLAGYEEGTTLVCGLLPHEDDIGVIYDERHFKFWFDIFAPIVSDFQKRGAAISAERK